MSTTIIVIIILVITIIVFAITRSCTPTAIQLAGSGASWFSAAATAAANRMPMRICHLLGGFAASVFARRPGHLAMPIMPERGLSPVASCMPSSAQLEGPSVTCTRRPASAGRARGTRIRAARRSRLEEAPPASSQG